MKHLIYWIPVVLSSVLLGACVPAATPIPVENNAVSEEPTQLPTMEAPTQQELQPTALPQISGPTETPSVESFSLSNSNSVPPDDILKEISYFQGGGGGICDQEYRQPGIDSQYTVKDVKLWEDISITTCGWEKDELVTVQIERPDGKTETFTKTTTDMRNPEPFGLPPVYGFSIDYKTDLSYPQGDYKFTFSGNNETFQYTVAAFFKPNFIYKRPEIFLYGFQPTERIRLIFYNADPSKSNFPLSGWQEYRVNSNGQLRIRVDNPAENYFVVGDLSGYIGNIRGIDVNIMK